ncbi:hypothetical protein F5X68DRAFT_218557 [Plectosphaerella plurivora]|uniref:Microbial-type PARG catalytic domain-containing protein n=1 Tax=Plectosphaerella plurivora TaxID=936078 RepID=A0A9P8UYE4_9PEZI|nr:hypothetical protein F5X68DRAFT_218557 [Plectosphaerella plurivora]
MSRQTSISDFFGTPRGSRRPQSNPRTSRQEASTADSDATPSSSSRRPSSRQMSSASASGSRGGRGGGRGGYGRGGGNNPNNTRRNTNLALVAKETLEVLPGILKEIPHINAAYSIETDLAFLPPLTAADCPGFGAATIRVVNEDTINAAIDLAAKHTRADGPVAILNLASDKHAGGGWLKGARAQEEALCYRSSLALSLHKRYYPFRSGTTCLYTPDMVIIRGDSDSGHDLLVPEVAPTDLPVMSCISVAAIRNPDTRDVPGPKADRTGFHPSVEVFQASDRILTKAKMRVAIRMAATQGHKLLVLGALGCGAFHNPPTDVAHCWGEVLAEPEFAGGWWKDVVFAVLDKRSEGNYEIFDELLGGNKV